MIESKGIGYIYKNVKKNDVLVLYWRRPNSGQNTKSIKQKLHNAI